MSVNGRKLAGWGCGVLALGAVLVAGTLTWYSAKLTGSFRQVKQSEKELIAATHVPADWNPPAGGLPEPARLEAFCGVRESLAEWRQRLAAEEQRQSAGGRGWWARAGGATDLAQTMAEYWVVRNEALRKAGLGPGEYAWLYGLVYYGWLGHDPAEGSQPGTEAWAGRGGPAAAAFERWRSQWQGGVATATEAALAPLRARLEAGWTAETNPVELIFLADEATPPAR